MFKDRPRSLLTRTIVMLLSSSALTSACQISSLKAVLDRPPPWLIRINPLSSEIPLPLYEWNLPYPPASDVTTSNEECSTSEITFECEGCHPDTFMLDHEARSLRIVAQEPLGTKQLHGVLRATWSNGFAAGDLPFIIETQPFRKLQDSEPCEADADFITISEGIPVHTYYTKNQGELVLSLGDLTDQICGYTGWTYNVWEDDDTDLAEFQIYLVGNKLNIFLTQENALPSGTYTFEWNVVPQDNWENKKIRMDSFQITFQDAIVVPSVPDLVWTENILYNAPVYSSGLCTKPMNSEGQDYNIVYLTEIKKNGYSVITSWFYVSILVTNIVIGVHSDSVYLYNDEGVYQVIINCVATNQQDSEDTSSQSFQLWIKLSASVNTVCDTAVLNADDSNLQTVYLFLDSYYEVAIPQLTQPQECQYYQSLEVWDLNTVSNAQSDWFSFDELWYDLAGIPYSNYLRINSASYFRIGLQKLEVTWTQVGNPNSATQNLDVYFCQVLAPSVTTVEFDLAIVNSEVTFSVESFTINPAAASDGFTISCTSNSSYGWLVATQDSSGQFTQFTIASTEDYDYAESDLGDHEITIECTTTEDSALYTQSQSLTFYVSMSCSTGCCLDVSLGDSVQSVLLGTTFSKVFLYGAECESVDWFSAYPSGLASINYQIDKYRVGIITESTEVEYLESQPFTYSFVYTMFGRKDTKVIDVYFSELVSPQVVAHSLQINTASQFEYECTISPNTKLFYFNISYKNDPADQPSWLTIITEDDKLKFQISADTTVADAGSYEIEVTCSASNNNNYDASNWHANSSFTVVIELQDDCPTTVLELTTESTLADSMDVLLGSTFTMNLYQMDDQIQNLCGAQTVSVSANDYISLETTVDSSGLIAILTHDSTNYQDDAPPSSDLTFTWTLVNYPKITYSQTVRLNLYSLEEASETVSYDKAVLQGIDTIEMATCVLLLGDDEQKCSKRNNNSVLEKCSTGEFEITYTLTDGSGGELSAWLTWELSNSNLAIELTLTNTQTSDIGAYILERTCTVTSTTNPDVTLTSVSVPYTLNLVSPCVVAQFDSVTSMPESVYLLSGSDIWISVDIPTLTYDYGTSQGDPDVCGGQTVTVTIEDGEPVAFISQDDGVFVISSADTDTSQVGQHTIMFTWKFETAEYYTAEATHTMEVYFLEVQAPTAIEDQTLNLQENDQFYIDSCSTVPTTNDALFSFDYIVSLTDGSQNPSWLTSEISNGQLLFTHEGSTTSAADQGTYDLQVTCNFSSLTDSQTLQSFTYNFVLVTTYTEGENEPPSFVLAPKSEYTVTGGESLSIYLTVLDSEFDDFLVSVGVSGDTESFTVCEISTVVVGSQVIECLVEPSEVSEDSRSTVTITITQNDEIISVTEFLLSVEEVESEQVEDAAEDVEEAEVKSYSPPTADLLPITDTSSLKMGNFSYFQEPLKIKSANITQIGLVTVVYNQPVKTQIDNLKLSLEQTSEYTALNFTYDIVENEKNYVKLQLNFQRPLYVSAGDLPDKIQLFIPIEIDIQTRVLKTEIEYLKIEITLPKMVKDEQEMLQLESAAATAESATATTFWIYLVLALLLKGVMGMMWGLFQALQLVTSFPLFFVKVPTNVVMIQAGFNKILNMEIIDKEEVYKSTFGKVIPEQDEYNPNDGSSEAKGILGYSETNMLKILSLLLVGLMIFLFLGVLFFIAYRCLIKRCSAKIKNFYRVVKGKIFYNTILRTSLQSYLGVSISTLFALNLFISNPILSMQNTMTVGVTLVLIAWPFITLRVVKKRQNHLKEPSVISSIGTLYINQDPYKKKTCREYHMWYMYRRMLIAIAIVFLESNFWQIAIAGYSSAMVVWYLVVSAPMDKRHHNWLAVYNESVLYVSSIMLVCFTDFIHSPEDRHELGYMYLYWLTLSLVFVNFIALSYDIIKELQLRCKRNRKRKVHQARLKQQQEAKLHNQNPQAVAPTQSLTINIPSPGFQNKKLIVPDSAEQVKLDLTRIEMGDSSIGIYDMTPSRLLGKDQSPITPGQSSLSQSSSLNESSESYQTKEQNISVGRQQEGQRSDSFFSESVLAQSLQNSRRVHNKPSLSDLVKSESSHREVSEAQSQKWLSSSQLYRPQSSLHKSSQSLQSGSVNFFSSQKKSLQNDSHYFSSQAPASSISNQMQPEDELQNQQSFQAASHSTSEQYLESSKTPQAQDHSNNGSSFRISEISQQSRTDRLYRHHQRQ